MAQPSKEEQKNGLARIKGALANPEAKAMIAEVLPAIAKAYLTPERIGTIVLTAASRNPLLAICTPASVLKAIMEIAPLGLEIGGPLGHVYLVPFFNKYISAYEAVPIPGYMGYVALAYRTEKVQSICADAIYEGDVFKHVRHEDRDEFHHERLNKTQEIVGFYCRAIYKDGGCHIEQMFTDEVEKIRQRSRAKDSGPWKTDYVPMGKKTTVRQARKFWPQSFEIAKLVSLDNRVDTGEYIDASRVIEAVPVEVEKPATEALADRILENGNSEPADDGPPMPPDPEPPEAQAPAEKKNGEANGRKPRTYAHEGEDEKKAEFIMNYIMDASMGEVAKATEMLATLTAFKGRDKSMVPGVEDCKFLSPKRLNIVFHQVQKLIERSGGGEGKDKKDSDDIPF